MKSVFALMSLISVYQVLNACPTCAGTMTDTCAPFFSASCYTTMIHDEGSEDTRSSQSDILILKGEQDHEEKK